MIMGITTIPIATSSLNTTTQLDTTVKMENLITKFHALRRRRDSNIEPLVQVLINIIVVVASLEAIVVVLISEFCEKL